MTLAGPSPKARISSMRPTAWYQKGTGIFLASGLLEFARDLDIRVSWVALLSFGLATMAALNAIDAWEKGNANRKEDA